VLLITVDNMNLHIVAMQSVWQQHHDIHWKMCLYWIV